MKKRFIICTAVLAALLFLLPALASAEQVSGSLRLEMAREEWKYQLWYSDGEYDWQNDPQGQLSQLVGQYKGEWVEDEPIAATRISLSDAQGLSAESIGEVEDYRHAACLLANELGMQPAQDATLGQLLSLLFEEKEALDLGLIERVTRGEWANMACKLWLRPGEELTPEQQMQACLNAGALMADENGDMQSGKALTFGEMYRTLVTCLAQSSLAESLETYREAFEMRGALEVNRAFLLSVMAEVISPERDGNAYLVLCKETCERLNLWGEEEYTYYNVRILVDDEEIDALLVREGESVELPDMEDVTWFGDPEVIVADTIISGYSTLRVTFKLVNAEEFADRMGDHPDEWRQNVLYGHYARPDSDIVEGLAANGLTIVWEEEASRRVRSKKTLEGTLVELEPTATAAPTATPEPSAIPTAEPTATPVLTPEPTATALPIYTVTFVYPPQMGYATEAESRVTVQVQYGAAANPPAVDESRVGEHYTFSWPGGWEKVTRDMTIEGVLTPKNYALTFRVLNAAGEEVSVQTVDCPYGSTPVPPAVALEPGESVQWENLPHQVSGSCEVVGRIQPMEPLITYVLVDLQGNRTVIKTEKIAYGGNATLPAVEIPEGYEVDWSGTLSNLTQDTEIVGTMTRRIHIVTVEVYDPQGALYFTQPQEVFHGESATPPAFTVPEGYTFAWDEGTDFANVTSSRTLTGHLTQKTFQITFVVVDAATGAQKSELGRVASVRYGETVPLPSYDPSLLGGGSVSWENVGIVTADRTVTGTYYTPTEE